MARRPDIAAASADLAFAVLAFASGLAGASVLYAILIFVGAAIAWAWMRRAALAHMALAQRLANTALALGLLAVVLGGAYWLGLALGGQS